MLLWDNIREWIDYSDAIVDIIQTYFRTRMEPHTHAQIGAPRGGGNPLELRKEVMGDIKEFHLTERFRGFFRTYFGDDDSIPKETAVRHENRKVEFMKELDLINSRIKAQESENYTFMNYHGQPLVKEEYEVLLELEQQVGEIPKWDYILGENMPKELSKFNYVIFGNHIIGLTIADKGLTFLPQSINQLSFLQNLYLPNNNLTELPASIGQLEYLEELILPDNALKSLPESIGELTNLMILHLENNDLTTLPETICNLKTLWPIGLSNNKISSLSENILKMCMPQAKVTIAAKYSGIRKKIQCELDLVGNPIMETKK